MDSPIGLLASTTAAFLGRARRGPLNTPVFIENFSAFRDHFGGCWSGSMLADAVQQFFSHGGTNLYVVRIANNARGARIDLPGPNGPLVLEAAEPSSTEHVRAAVDYDGIEDEKGQYFNLTLQRVAPDSSIVLDQEIYRRLSCQSDNVLFVGSELAKSQLAHVCNTVPAYRPDSTGAGYINQTEMGTDGSALSDYDLIGSPELGTGMFSLNKIEEFDLLYIAPSMTSCVPGPAAVLAAEIYCRRRGTMLILDPPETWMSTSDALEGFEEAGYAHPDVLSYFPRAKSSHSATRDESIAIGGAIAGLLCKLDRQSGPWEDLDQQGFELSHDLLPALDIPASEAHRLVKGGLNVIVGQTPGYAMVCGSVTLAYGSQSGDQFTSLTTRRLCLSIKNAVDSVTRRTVFKLNTAAVKEHIVADVRKYMDELVNAGALKNDRFSVDCDTNQGEMRIDCARDITISLTFDPACSDETIRLNICQAKSDSEVASQCA